jgi:ascorbate-specific PTS system EIIC-type component UlaA
MTSWVGVAAIALIVVVVPVALGAWLIIANVLAHRSSRHELTFWMLCLIPLGPLAVFVPQGILGVFDYNGGGVVSATVFAFPGGLVPIIATVAISTAFFDDTTWASIGYFSVMPTYLVGLALWQLVTITGLRRLIQLSRRGRRPERVGPHPAKRAVANGAA